MARLRLSRFGEGQVFPHEETLSGPKVDRLMLTTVCKANLSQVFGLYPDPAHQAQRILDEAVGRHHAAGGDRSPGRGQSPLAGHRRHGDRRHRRA